MTGERSRRSGPGGLVQFPGAVVASSKPGDENWHEAYEKVSDALHELHASYIELAIDNEQLRSRIVAYETSRAHALARRLVRVSGGILPPGSSRRRVVAKVAAHLLRRRTGEQIAQAAYAAWLAGRAPDDDALRRQRAESQSWTRTPLISICMPVYNPEPANLRAAIRSVEAQSYPHWELCICDDRSTRAGVRQVLREEEAAGSRISVTCSEHNGGISAATNQALSLAQGSYVAFLDDDDLLEPHALYLFVKELQYPDAPDIVYSDEDLLQTGGKRAYPLLKPGWSPEALLSMNYITHFVMVRRQLVDDVGGLRPQFDGAQDHDLLLRLTEHTDAIRHVPDVLYSWRQSSTSASLTSSAKPWAYKAGIKAVEDALHRRNLEATVDDGAFPGAYRVRYALPTPPPTVTIVVPTRDRVDLLRRCIDSVQNLTDYRHFSILIVDNDSREDETLSFLRDRDLATVPAPGPFNYSAIMNTAFAACTSEFVLTLNNDTEILDKDWLVGLLELCAQPGVGAAGCRLIRPDGTVQHAGIIVGVGPPAANFSFDTPGLRILGDIPAVRDVTAVTGACCMIRRSAWEAVGGFDEGLGVAYNDVDFCLRLRQRRYRILYTPYVTVMHAESSSRGPLHPPADEARFVERWGRQLAVGDPYFPPRVGIGKIGLEMVSADAGFRGKDLVELTSPAAGSEPSSGDGGAGGRASDEPAT